MKALIEVQLKKQHGFLVHMGDHAVLICRRCIQEETGAW